MRESKIKAFFRDYVFVIVVSISSAFIGTALVLLIKYFIEQVISNVAFGTGILAIATIGLAIAASWAIWQNYQFHARERKERLLNEIIEWAESVAKSSLETGVFDETIPVSGLAAERALPELLDSVADFRVARAESVYISSIASEISPKLKKSVDNLTEEIKGQIKFLMEYKRKDIPTWPANEVVAKIAGNNERLYNLAETLIDDTANILKKDL
jgi:hypothetical protein